MKPFCEIVVVSVLPAVRALITKDLMDVHNLNQTQISQKLGITQPAISQYRKELRGQRVKTLESSKQVMAMIQDLSQRIADGTVTPQQMHERFCEICKQIREEKIICQMHENAYPLLAPCKSCFVC